MEPKQPRIPRTFVFSTPTSYRPTFSVIVFALLMFIIQLCDASTVSGLWLLTGWPFPRTPPLLSLALNANQVIDSMDTYFHVLAANPDNIVVVKVFAGFCRACKAFDRKYRKLALEYEAAGANIKFYEMDWMQTRDLCKSLQVRGWVRGCAIYGMKLVAAFTGAASYVSSIHT